MENRQDLVVFDKYNFKYKAQAEPSLFDIDLKVKKGEKILIVGPSGSGKSTLAKSLNGQIPNTFPGDLTGSCLIDGKNLTDSSIFDLSLSVGTVLQDTDGQFVGLTVAEDIAFSLENDNVDQEEMKKIVHKWADELGLGKLLDMKPGELSGGQKQSVSIAGVLVSDVPILLLDEPLANLDPQSGRKTMKLLKKLADKLGYTVIVIEHRLEEALLLDPDRIVVIADGNLVADLSPTDLLKTDILEKIGIRRPLYIDAMKYAGIDFSSYDKLADFDQVQILEKDLEKIENWAESQERKEDEKSGQNLIKIENLTFAYEKENILQNISLEIDKGEIISILGPNGAGKSTLAKLLCGFLRPDEGRIFIGGKDSKDLSIKEIADSIGFILQNPNAMISKAMIYDEVAFGLRVRGLSEEEIKEKVNKALEICGLYSFRKWPISALSYGQKRRVTIASILVLDPEVIILDEPTAGQDLNHYTKMMEFIREINKKYGLTILMISHDMHLIEEYTDRAIVIGEKKILADTTPAELFSQRDLIDRANLAETSLFKLGQRLKNMEALDFIEAFIGYERRKRHE
ncbi:ABC transporter ATP-binding protein [Anaerococcus degeneri]|uniref:ABC transporter ATP-binding protein n=1 Tax=Anaerococcus degeneri TaxID=361500 RepID=A0ABS7YWQ0_9FIRM|nr:ABC transporter ATP-binding protein [Anaerococcus degeneri]MBP2015269.1 energy-coupling factor transport system ATP-binding protein [Anaerococcus degeneri]MCA2096165.1 ABC transporter ATP-binding protein [Anaerococcus degeneri]